MDRRQVTSYGRKGKNYVRTKDASLIPSPTTKRTYDTAPQTESIEEPSSPILQVKPSHLPPVPVLIKPKKENAPPHTTKRGKKTAPPSSPPRTSTHHAPKQHKVGGKSGAKPASPRAPLKPKSIEGHQTTFSARTTRASSASSVVEIISFDAQGTEVGREERTCHSVITISSDGDSQAWNEQAKRVKANVKARKPAPKKPITKRIVISSDEETIEDSEEEEVLYRSPKKNGTKSKLIVITDDEDDVPPPPPSTKPLRPCQQTNGSRRASKKSDSSSDVTPLEFVPIPVKQPARTNRKTSTKGPPPEPTSRQSLRPSSSQSSQDVRARLAGSIAALPKEVRDEVMKTGDLTSVLQHLTPRTRVHLGEPEELPITREDEQVEVEPVQSAEEIEEIANGLGALSVKDSRPEATQPSPPEPKARRKTTQQPRAKPSSPLSRLLKRCNQSEVLDFESFVATFPHDDVHGKRAGKVEFRKLGEASYSEVFAIGDVVVKIVPLSLDEPLPSDRDMPSVSPIADVEKEIVITEAIGEVHNGFIKLIKTFVMSGSYPAHLLDLWDEYEAAKGSESFRPHVLPPSTHYAAIVLPNGGTDLESYAFSPKTCWQACVAIFWQITRSLAVAEDSHNFEHRDLHWGQVLIKDDPSQRGGVTATIIDLGLSRMKDVDGRIYHTAFEPEIFEGQGDYQFDVYRLMRDTHGSDWEDFKPLTNVMWLHYLAVKMLKHKGLKKPAALKSSSTRRKTSLTPAQVLAEEERCWYDTLVEIEEHLRRATKPAPKTKKSAATGDPPPRSACDVMYWVIERTKSD